MKQKNKVILQALLFFGIFGLTLWSVFAGEDLSRMWEAMTDCNFGWLVPAVICVFLFIWGESIIIWYLMGCCGILLEKRVCFLFSSVGFFFSCVTPSASGGQPMQIYYMKKEQIPIPVSTVILLIVTITYKAVLVFIGLGILFFAQDFTQQYLNGILPVFYLGIVLNVFCVVGMCVLVFHPTLAGKVIIRGYNLLEKMHLMRHKEERLAKLEASMESYHDTADFVKTHIGIVIRVFLITLVQRVALFAVTCFVYRAMHLSGTGWYTILMLQAVVSVSVDMLPLPGGMGISEKLFEIIFAPVFGSLLLPGMVLSRGLGYYSELLISAIFTIIAVFVFARRSKRNEKWELL